MPDEHRIVQSERRAFIRVWGPPDAQSAITAILSLAEDPEFQPHYDVLVDARELDEGDPDLGEIEQVAGTLKTLRDSYRGRLAVIAPFGRFFDLLNLMSAFAQSYGVRIRIFTTQTEAEEWLQQRETARRMESDRLELRPATAGDLDSLHGLWTDPSVRKFLFDNEVISKGRLLAEIDASDRIFVSGGLGLWVLLSKREREFVGFCGFRTFRVPPQLQLLYGITPAYRGKGLAVEAGRRVIRYAFEEAGLERVVSSVDLANEASIRVMEQLGMKLWKRERVGNFDGISYSISREEGRVLA